LSHGLRYAPTIDFNRDSFNKTMEIDRELWKQEISSHDELFSKLYDRLPKEFTWIKELIVSSLWRSPEKWALAEER
jgi:phosphoenolpyruvate carboxykinase (GTP)